MMNIVVVGTTILILTLLTQLENAVAETAKANAGQTQYALGTYNEVKYTYPDADWLPIAYKKYYEDDSLESTVELYTKSSLDNDGIKYSEVLATYDEHSDQMWVAISSTDSAAQDYSVMHPAFIKNYLQALNGIEKCKNAEHCWNKGDTNKQEPWAFFPQFGMAMAQQKAILFLNYPPYTALTEKSYLDTFTMQRWSRVLEGVGITEPNLFNVIVDARPIAAPGSGASQYLPDAMRYFNNEDSSEGGYYITPQLNLMLDPPTNASNEYTLPVVVLGSTARETWAELVHQSSDLLSTGRVKLPGSSKITPYILGNHPDVTTYQCCSGDPNPNCSADSENLIADEQIDVQVVCWMKSMAENPGQNPQSALTACTNQWVNSASTTDEHIMCVLEQMDNDACFENPRTKAQATAYCGQHNNNACATYVCPASDSKKSISGKPASG